MINFRQRTEVLPSALILASIVMMAVTLLYMVFVPTPSVAGLVKGSAASRQRIQDQIITTKANEVKAQKAVAPRLWTGDPETVSASVLAQLTLEAQKRAITIGAFRPQRTVDLAGVTELPYIVQMSGSYRSLYAVLATLSANNSKVVLRSVQIASSQAENGTAKTSGSAVTATVGLSAYLPAAPAAAASSTRGGAHG